MIKYEKPKFISIVNTTQAASCHDGSYASDCSVGMTASNNCNAGNVAQKAGCKTGSVAKADCGVGNTANAICVLGSTDAGQTGVTTINPLSDSIFQYNKR
jgi:SynChlorMet cassette protein ScmA